MRSTSARRATVAPILAAAILLAAFAGALMLTCADDALGAVPSPSHAGGPVCTVHRGHVGVDASAVVVTPPSADDVAETEGPLSPRPLSGHRVQIKDSPQVPPSVGDPLCGRLRL
jgi:hypothetical protein